MNGGAHLGCGRFRPLHHRCGNTPCMEDATLSVRRRPPVRKSPCAWMRSKPSDGLYNSQLTRRAPCGLHFSRYSTRLEVPSV
jgi:hypothetical protein